ncbi:MAG: ABC transporter substrate-binding protein [Planctomycetaceae bacterium]|nr:ABC transporter substrate-binding protein [Planctomycetaceae bacterium]
MRALLAATVVFVLCFTAGAEESSSAPRIISLYAAHTEILLRLGARDAIIGVSRQESYAGPETEGWNPPVFSARDDIERFIAAAPDIVLVRPQHVADGRLRRVLETAGITVISMQVTHADELYDYWRELGRLVGREAEAEAMIASFAAEANRYRQAALKRNDPPGVFLESIHREVKTFTPDSLPAWVIETGGGRNIAGDAEAASPGVIIAEYGLERLLAKADEVEIFISQSGAMNRTPLETVLARGVYSPLAAFQSGRVYKIPEACIARPTPSLLEGLRLMAEWTGLTVDDDATRE